MIKRTVSIVAVLLLVLKQPSSLFTLNKQPPLPNVGVCPCVTEGRG